MRIEPIRDEAFILECLTHPRIWPHISCDGVTKEQMRVIDAFGYLCPVDEELGRLGVFVMEMRGPVWLEVHTCLLPKAWGPKAAEAAAELARYLAAGGIRKLTTLVPHGNVVALRFAKAAGMVEEGVIRKSLPRNGQMIDQTLLGMEICQQHQH